VKIICGVINNVYVQLFVTNVRIEVKNKTKTKPNRNEKLFYSLYIFCKVSIKNSEEYTQSQFYQTKILNL
jgi:hypothetical protein